MAGRVSLLRRLPLIQVCPHTVPAVALLQQQTYVNARVRPSSDREAWSHDPNFLAFGILGIGCASWLENRQSAPARCELQYGQRAQGKAAEDAFKQMMGPGTIAQVRAYTTGGKLRIIDIVDDKSVFHEIKTGNVIYCQKIRSQIEKDINILANSPDCKGYNWDVFPNKNGDVTVTKSVKDALEKNGIKLNIHRHSPESCRCFQNQAKDALKEGREVVRNATAKEKIAMGVKQATVLKVVGGVNLAVALLALGSSIYIMSQVSKIRADLPELAADCERLESRLQVICHKFEVALSQSKSALDGRESEFKDLMRGVQDDFKTIKARCEQIVADADHCKSQAEVNAVLGALTVAVGLAVTIFSVGCDCGAGVAMGLGGIGAGGVATGVSLENATRCNNTMMEAGQMLDAVMLKAATVDRQFTILMGLLSDAIECHLVGNLWRVHGMDTNLGFHEITHIGRSDSIAMLKNVGGGSVLGAKGKDVFVVNYNGAVQGVLCSIENIWQESNGFYRANLQCRARMQV